MTVLMTECWKDCVKDGDIRWRMVCYDVCRQGHPREPLIVWSSGGDWPYFFQGIGLLFLGWLALAGIVVLLHVAYERIYYN